MYIYSIGTDRRAHHADLRELLGAELAAGVPAMRALAPGEPSPGADVGGVCPVPVQMWQG